MVNQLLDSVTVDLHFGIFTFESVAIWDSKHSHPFFLRLLRLLEDEGRLVGIAEVEEVLALKTPHNQIESIEGLTLLHNRRQSFD